MKKNILTTISLTILFLNIYSSQTGVKKIANPYFEIVNMDSTGKTTSVKLLVNKKVNHDVEHEYPLNAEALSKQLLIKNQKILYMPYGSQGLFDEVPLIIE